MEARSCRCQLDKLTRCAHGSTEFGINDTFGVGRALRVEEAAPLGRGCVAFRRFLLRCIP